MKRHLKISVDTLLHHTSVPEPDLRSSLSERKKLYMNAVATRHQNHSSLAGQSFWRAGSGALVFAGVGLFVLIGASSIMAMAGRARPGDTLYSLNRAWERTQLAITQDEAEKLKLKLAFAEERLSEVAAIEIAPNQLTEEVVSNTEQALSEIDDQLDRTKLALEFGEQTSIGRDEVDDITQQFSQVVENYQADITEVSQLIESDNAELAESAASISNVAASLSAEPITDGTGYYLQLDGKLSPDSQKFTTLGYELDLAGNMNTTAFSGLDVKVDGWVSGRSISPELAYYEDEQLGVINDETIYSAVSQLQKDDAGMFVQGPNGQRIALTGEVSQDKRLNNLVGQEVGLTAAWQADGSAELKEVTSSQDDSELVIPDVVEPNTEDTGESLPATNPAEPDIPPPGFDE